MDDPRLDLTDLFAFGAPGERTVLIMDVHPFATGDDALHPDAVYRINVDTDGDHRADVAFSFTFSWPEDGQTVTVHRATGPEARRHDVAGERIIADAPVHFGPRAEAVETGPYRFFAGLRSDPFFADLEGIGNDFRWTGNDTMADKNVFGLVLEMPDAELGQDAEIGVWMRASLRRDGQLTSVDRGAHPSLTAYFNEENAKDAYNAGEPADDWDTYLRPWTAVLQHTGGYDPQTAEQTLRTVLPDILRFDRGKPAAYPNGRKLTDDVTSARLAMVSGGKITTDHIGPHSDLLAEFPYLGAPHAVPVG
ncbi:DUF4331 family protein [Saccharopolyspora taberi]|uniref:DUF4331 domain-containing protein n=1 Tax=Saccharopolyspora taberi TaxID=60895 RepID=A0ABN3VB27_9PSEU